MLQRENSLSPKNYAIAAYALEHRLTIASESVREFLELVYTAPATDLESRTYVRLEALRKLQLELAQLLRGFAAERHEAQYSCAAGSNGEPCRYYKGKGRLGKEWCDCPTCHDHPALRHLAKD